MPVHGPGWSRVRLAALAATLLVAAACAGTNDAGGTGGAAGSVGTPTTNLRDRCVDDFDPAVDYFPDKVTLDLAESVRIRYQPNYKVIEYADPAGEYEPATYVLVQCGTPTPELTGDLAGATAIEVPVRKTVVTAKPVYPWFEKYGAIDTIAAVGADGTITTPGVQAGIDQGRIATAGKSSAPNLEVIVAATPDLVVLSPPYDAESKSRMEAAGLPVFVHTATSESTPLSRAEWTSKIVSMLFNAEADATSSFTGITDRYRQVAERAANVAQRPRVAAFHISSDGITVRRAGGWQVRLFEDAGATYIFDDKPDDPGSDTLDLETVLARAGDADFLIDSPGAPWRTIGELLADEPRFDAFKAVREGQVVNLVTGRVPGETATDFYEAGVANPDELLADLVTIFHPELLPDRDPRFHFLLAPG